MLLIGAQDRIVHYPLFKTANERQEAVRKSVTFPGRNWVWQDSDLCFMKGSEWYRVSAKTTAIEKMKEPPSMKNAGRRGRGGPGRGRQWTEIKSPDGNWTAQYKDGNVTLSGKQTLDITKDGDLAKRIKYGTASWVYGEELGQNEAMGFSPDSRYLWLYRFDESKVKDFPTLEGQRRIIPEVTWEPYPKAGDPNPAVDLFLYDTKDGTLHKVAVRTGEFSAGLGHLVYGIQFSKDSKDLYFHRANRIQNEVELCAVDCKTHQVRVVDREANPAGWVEPDPRWDLSEGQRPGHWIIRSEADGFMNFYWLDVQKGKRAPITALKADVSSLLLVDAKRQEIWFDASDEKFALRRQIWRAKWDGTKATRLTNPEFDHSASVAPDGSGFVVMRQNGTTSPVVEFLDRDGKVRKQLDAATVPPQTPHAQYFRVKSLDGKVELDCRLSLPPDGAGPFPLLMGVYGGPPGAGPLFSGESFSLPERENYLGFATLDVFGRGQNGRGRAFRQAFFRNLGGVEIDDMAAGVLGLKGNPKVDLTRVGIHGVSYGGYASLMALLRYPDVFHAASSGSILSDWRNYDTIYTERFMGLPADNKDGYDRSAPVNLAKNLKGWLQLYYGSADDNTHPTNALQMISALNRAGKWHEVQVGPDQGHSGVNNQRMLEFFIERLGIDPLRAR